MKSSPIINKSARRASLRFSFSRRNVVLSLLVSSLLLCTFLSNRPSGTNAQSRKPFDLISLFPDSNGFDLNPKWAAQEEEKETGVPDPNKLCFNNNGEFEGCTSDKVDFDEPDPWKILHQTCRVTSETKVKGHINWRPVAYEARIQWSEFSIDGDYCFELVPVNKNGLTANRDSIHAEFHAGETIKQFDTPWWKDFRKSVGFRNVGLPMGAKEKEFVEKFINGKRAIVIGLLNLDCVHKCYTELHPVYAIAINIKTEKHGDKVDEVWAIFARNWGNEGWCSSNQHDLVLESNANKLKLTLPWGPDTPAGKTAVSFDMVEDGTKFLSNNNQATGPELSIAGNQGVMLSFVLPAAEDQARIHGELRLRWAMPKIVTGQLSTSFPSSTVMSAVSTETQTEEIDERLLFDALGEEGRRRAASDNQPGKPDAVPSNVRIKKGTETNRLFSVFDESTRTERLIIEPPPPAQPPHVRSRYDKQKAEREKRLLGIPPN